MTGKTCDVVSISDFQHGDLQILRDPGLDRVPYPPGEEIRATNFSDDHGGKV